MPSIPATFLAGQPLMATQSLAAVGVAQQNVALVQGQAAASQANVQSFDQLADRLLQRMEQKKAAAPAAAPAADAAPPSVQDQIEELSKTLADVTQAIKGLQEDMHRLQCPKPNCPPAY